jgi:hypothetical protein
MDKVLVLDPCSTIYMLGYLRIQRAWASSLPVGGRMGFGGVMPESQPSCFLVECSQDICFTIWSPCSIL